MVHAAYLIAHNLIRSWLDIGKSQIVIVVVSFGVPDTAHVGSERLDGFTVDTALAKNTLQKLLMPSNRDCFITTRIKRLAVLRYSLGQIFPILRFLDRLIGKLSHHLLRFLKVTFTINGKTVDVLDNEIKDISRLS